MFKEIAGQQLEGGLKSLYNVKNWGGRGRRGRKGDVQNVYCIDFFYITPFIDKTNNCSNVKCMRMMLSKSIIVIFVHQ